MRYDERMAQANDRPGVIAPPPLIALIAVVAGLLLDRTLPAHGLDTLAFWPRVVAGAFIAIAGGDDLAGGKLRRLADGVSFR